MKELKFNPFTLRWRNVTMHFPLINQYWGMDYEEPKNARRDEHFFNVPINFIAKSKLFKEISFGLVQGKNSWEEK